MIFRYLVVIFSFFTLLASGHVMAMMKCESSIVSLKSITPTIDQFLKPGKYSFSSPVLDSNKIAHDLLVDKPVLKSAEGKELYKTIIEEVCKSEDPDLQKRIYALLTNIPKCKDEKTATIILDNGIAQERAWAYWIKAQQESKGSITKWHCLAANRGHAQAKEYVESHQNIKSAKVFLEEINNVGNKKTVESKWKEQEKKWNDLNYARPLLELYSVIKLKKTHLKDLSINKHLLDIIKEDVLLEKAVEFGSNEKIAIDHMLRLADNYDKKGNYTESLRYYLKAARLGNPVAMHSVGNFYDDGFPGFVSDKKQALDWYLRAVENGYPYAINNLGLILEEGVGWQSANKETILELYLKLAEYYKDASEKKLNEIPKDLLEKKLDDLWVVESRLIKFYLENIEYNKKPENYDPILGLPNVMNNIGRLLSEGFNKKKLAAKWFYVAANRELPQAMSNFARLLEDGYEGQPADTNAALEWYMRAAEKNFPKAMNNAGVILKVSGKKAEALKLFLKAAEIGVPYAMYNSALLLAEGFEGQKPNIHKAIEYLHMAIESKDKEVSVTSMLYLALIHLGYYDVTEDTDDVEALYWLKSAEKDKKDTGVLLSIIENPTTEEEAERGEKEETEVQKLENILTKIETPLVDEISIESRTQNKQQALTPEIIKSEVSVSMEDKGGGERTVEESFPESDETKEEQHHEEHKKEEITYPTESKYIQKERVKLNAKGLREKAIEIRRKLRSKDNSFETRNLAPCFQETVNRIFDGDKKLVWKEITDLFGDHFFSDGYEVKITPTKSGYKIIAINSSKSKLLVASASTHRQHGSDRNPNQLDPGFIQDLRKILEIFELKRI
ncbi:MAG TPA: hypothetical protein DCZ38_03170 [Coxiellaceae bacterium]|nr:hypothetical protein [Coxiellaceae bacterium]